MVKWRVVLIQLLILSSLSYCVEINGVDIQLTGGTVSESEFDRVIKIVRSLQNRGYNNASLEIAQFLRDNISPEVEGKAIIENARAIFLTMNEGFKKSYRIMDDYMMSNIASEDFEREYFIEAIMDMTTNPIKMRTSKEVYFTNSSSDKCATDEYTLENMFDLQWSVNFLGLIKNLDVDKYNEGKSRLLGLIDEEREISITFYHQSSPQISVERAKDEAIAGISYWGVDNVSGSLIRELDRKFNITGFGLCVGRPLSLLEISKKVKDDISFGDVVIDRTIEYEEDDYSAYRSIARCVATLNISISELFAKYGINAHKFKPFVPKAPLIEKETDVEDDENIGQ